MLRADEAAGRRRATLRLPDDIAQGALSRQLSIQVDEGLIQRRPEDRRGFIQLLAHAHALSALAGKQERESMSATRTLLGPALRQAARGVSPDQGVKAPQQLVAP